MSAPIIFISHMHVKDVEAYRRMAPEVARQLEAEKPRTAAFLHYLDPEGARLTIAHVFADAEAMDRHFEGDDERSELAWQVMAPAGWEIYGPASEAAVSTMLRGAEAAGVPLTVHTDFVAGFLRTA